MAEDYNVRLKVFEGPLDLLLYLIKKDEVNICDIPIEKITSQYLKYIELMKMLDLNIAGEFLVMASTLMYIKSMMLLPPEERTIGEDDEGIDPRAELVQQLLEYKKFKELAGCLQEKEKEREDIFARVAPPELKDKNSGEISDVSIFDLISAFSEVLKVVGQEDLREIFEDRYTVGEKIDSIKKILMGKKKVQFFDFFSSSSSKSEIVVTFLAVLELIRLKLVKAVQRKSFGYIYIELVETT